VIAVLYSSVQRRWQLCDFGTSATATSKRLVVTSSRRGTGGYRAPEVLDTGVYNNKSDQFSLGCIAFELTFGTKLFRDDYGVLQFSHNPEGVFSTLWPRFHPHNDRVNTFKQIVFSLLAIDPRPRPSASETKVTLNSIYESIRHEEQESMDHHHSTVATFLVVSDNFSGGDVFVGTDGIWGEGGDGDRDGDGDGDGDGDWCLVEHKVTVLLKAAEVPLDIGVEV
jgi:serine/threonine protein kinase